MVMKPPSGYASEALQAGRASEALQAGRALTDWPSPLHGGMLARGGAIGGGCGSVAARLCLAACVLALVGCSQQELYSRLGERQVNEMVALLRNQDVQASKQRGKDGLQFTLLVPSGDFARAVELLHSAGYPRDDHDTLGGVFKKDGFVTTHLEERARFMHALAQELATTIQSIDGVVLARVHLAVPEKRRFTDKPETSAASVFIKHRPGLDLSPQLASIKALVVNAIEGLPYESVTVVTFAAEPWPGAAVRAASAGPALLAGLGMPLMAAAGLGGTALLAGGALWAWQRRRTPAEHSAAAGHGKDAGAGVVAGAGASIGSLPGAGANSALAAVVTSGPAGQGSQQRAHG